MSFCMLLSFGFFLILFLSLPLSKTKVDPSQTVHMKLKRFGPVCFLNYSNANLPVSYLGLLATVSLIAK